LEYPSGREQPVPPDRSPGGRASFLPALRTSLMTLSPRRQAPVRILIITKRAHPRSRGHATRACPGADHPCARSTTWPPCAATLPASSLRQPPELVSAAREVV